MDPAGVDPYAKIGRETGGELPPWERESSKDLARQATDESIVLLKNENNTLPLDQSEVEDHCGDWAVDRPGAAGLVQRDVAVLGQHSRRHTRSSGQRM